MPNFFSENKLASHFLNYRFRNVTHIITFKITFSIQVFKNFGILYKKILLLFILKTIKK